MRRMFDVEVEVEGYGPATCVLEDDDETAAAEAAALSIGSFFQTRDGGVPFVKVLGVKVVGEVVESKGTVD